MSQEQFDQTLREFKHRKPFIPFVVELTDGRRVIVARPSVLFGGGVGGYISETEGLMDFTCDEVRAISPITAESMR